MCVVEFSAYHSMSNTLSNLRLIVPQRAMGIPNAIAQTFSVPATDLLTGLGFAISASNMTAGIPIASPPEVSIPAPRAFGEGSGGRFQYKPPSI